MHQIFVEVVGVDFKDSIIYFEVGRRLRIDS